MRNRIFEIIEVSKGNNKLSTAYDIFMIFTIIISVIPLAFVQQYQIFDIVDKICVSVFIIDYILRLLTADIKMKYGMKSFVYYIFTPMAIIDMISILPSIMMINHGWRLLKTVRLLRTMKIIRVFKATRYSRNIQIFLSVFKKEKDLLVTIFGIALFYILISALVVLNVEPETFENYFKAIYWATISLTTMGYGDIYPTSIQGQMITMLSSIIGIAIVAMPAGVITAGFMNELNDEKQENKEN